MGELDSESALSQAKAFLRHRAPAIQGQGGDEHTYMTCQHLIDFGLSRQMCVEILSQWRYRLEGEEEGEPRSWNERCAPPWDVTGEGASLAAKARNAWEYRQRDVGEKSGGSVFAETEGLFAPPEELAKRSESSSAEPTGLLAHLYRGDELLRRNVQRQMVIPSWLIGHGVTGMIGKRGVGKSVVLLDLALRIAHDMDWHGVPIKQGYTAIYLCGEDDLGAQEHVHAWAKEHGVESLSQRFLFFDIITDLMSKEDVELWARTLRSELGDRPCVMFLDTWQRAIRMGSQNKDEHMQRAVAHAEALVKSLNGPTLTAFHPPKHDEDTISGWMGQENMTMGLWSLKNHPAGKMLECNRLRARGEGSYLLFEWRAVGLGEVDEFGDERTGVVPAKVGGVRVGASAEKLAQDKAAERERKEGLRGALARVLAEIETRRKDLDPESPKPYTVAEAVARIVGREGSLVELADIDDWAQSQVDSLVAAGFALPFDPDKMLAATEELLSDDPRGHDFGNGFALRIEKDGKKRRIVLSRSGSARDGARSGQGKATAEAPGAGAMGGKGRGALWQPVLPTALSRGLARVCGVFRPFPPFCAPHVPPGPHPARGPRLRHRESRLIAERGAAHCLSEGLRSCGRARARSRIAPEIMAGRPCPKKGQTGRKPGAKPLPPHAARPLTGQGANPSQPLRRQNAQPLRSTGRTALGLPLTGCHATARGLHARTDLANAHCNQAERKFPSKWRGGSHTPLRPALPSCRSWLSL